jgi:hypothetical protein
MILAYCITPQPARGGPTAKRFKYILVVPYYRFMVAKKFNPAPLVDWVVFGVKWREVWNGTFRLRPKVKNIVVRSLNFNSSLIYKA